jgi:hypothetical protein
MSGGVSHTASVARNERPGVRARRLLSRASLLVALFATPAAASPPTLLAHAFGPEDLRAWNRPLWMEELPSEAPRSITEASLSGGGTLSIEESADDSMVPPTVVSRPYAPGDSVSVGQANRGFLVDGVPLEANAHTLVRPGRNYGTQETVAILRSAIAAVVRRFPTGTHPLVVGDLSRPGGGRFKPHKSHQSGRDVDIGYYQTGTPPHRLMRVWPQNIDAARTWTLVEAMLADDQVQFMFIDWHLQKKLYEYARDEAGVPADKLAKWFSYPDARDKRGAPIKHLKGHADHIHVRFWSPQAVAAADAYLKLRGSAALQRAATPAVPVSYTVKKGDTLAKVAKKHRLDIKQLRSWNRLKGDALKPGASLVVGHRRP